MKNNNLCIFMYIYVRRRFLEISIMISLKWFTKVYDFREIINYSNISVRWSFFETSLNIRLIKLTAIIKIFSNFLS